MKYINLKVKVSDTGEIINVKELIDTLNKTEIDEDLAIFLTNLQNHISNSNYTNKDVLVDSINSHLLCYEANNNSFNDPEALKLIQKYFKNAKTIGIISTKEDNGTNNDYLTYINNYGDIEVLFCLKGNSINDFIKTHYGVLSTYSAEDIFNYFKEYVHVSLKFDKCSHNTSLNNLDSEQIHEMAIKQKEYEEVKKYADTYGISNPIEIAIDPHGERLYRLKDGLFKFKTENGKKIMEILQTPTINNNNNVLLSELDNNEISINNIEFNGIMKINNNNLDDDYDNLPIIELNKEQVNKTIKLLQKKDIYGIELSSEEFRTIDITIKSLIETMGERTKNSNSLEANLLDDFMRPILMIYQKSKEGINTKKALSNLEMHMCAKYLYYKEYLNANNLEKDNKKKIELSQNNNQKGTATVVMLPEIMLLALFIIMFSHLAI